MEPKSKKFATLSGQKHVSLTCMDQGARVFSVSGCRALYLCQISANGGHFLGQTHDMKTAIWGLCSRESQRTWIWLWASRLEVSVKFPFMCSVRRLNRQGAKGPDEILDREERSRELTGSFHGASTKLRNEASWGSPAASTCQPSG